jgi:uncharacterized protein YndB with AHSA1/START domain
LDGFIEHRHDQSILSLIAIRKDIELFRHPSQYGNHLKTELYRDPGEWLRCPYSTRGLYDNSPYGTLINHHRGRLDRQLKLEATVQVPRAGVFSTWTRPEKFKTLLYFFGHVAILGEQDVRPSGKYHFEMRSRRRGTVLYLAGTYVEVVAPERLVFTWEWYKVWPARTVRPIEMQVTVTFRAVEDRTEISLVHEYFPSEWSLEKHAIGWKILFQRLKKRRNTRKQEENELEGGEESLI